MPRKNNKNKSAAEQPQQQVEFSMHDYFYSMPYMNTMEALGRQLQDCMDRLADTNTKSMWEKSSESYKTMYRSLQQAKGALLKKSHKEVFDILENIGQNAEIYAAEKRGKSSWGATAKTRLEVADEIVACIKETMSKSLVKQMRALDDLHMPAFAAQRVEEKRKLMNASELAKKCNVSGWTELPSVKKKDAAANPEANVRKSKAL